MIVILWSQQHSYLNLLHCCRSPGEPFSEQQASWGPCLTPWRGLREILLQCSPWRVTLEPAYRTRSDGASSYLVEGNISDFKICQIGKHMPIFPTVNMLIPCRGHYNAWKLSTSLFPVRIEMLRLMNKMSAKILKILIGWHKPLKFWKCN